MSDARNLKTQKQTEAAYRQFFSLITSQHYNGLADKPSIYVAEVQDVSEANRTCDVEVTTGSTVVITGVQLMAGIDDGLLYVPTKGSDVVIAHLKNMPPFVLLFSQVDKILHIVGDTIIEMVNGTTTISQGEAQIILDGGKITVQNNDTITVQNKAQIVLDGDGKINIQNDDTITIQNKAQIILDNEHQKITIANSNNYNLFNILSDLIAKIQLISVPTPTGTSGYPLNAGDFSTTLSNLSNLLQ